MTTHKRSLGLRIGFWSGLGWLGVCGVTLLLPARVPAQTPDVPADWSALSSQCTPTLLQLSALDPKMTVFRATPCAWTTEVTDMNSVGTVIGHYRNQRSFTFDYGFLRARNGKITLFGAAPQTDTYPTAINSAGKIVGQVWGLRVGASSSAFVRDTNGSITIFDVLDSEQMFPTGINDRGVIAGVYRPVSSSDGHGFLRAADGTITVFDPPNARSIDEIHINSLGEVGGSFTDIDYRTHGYIRALNGKITVFDAPSSNYIQVVAINAAGQITGNLYDETVGRSQAFIRGRAGKFTVFDVLGKWTITHAISANGTVAGAYDLNYTGREGKIYVRYPNGRIQTINTPQPASGGHPVAINAAGVIAGVWKIGPHSEGFLRVP